jgi:SNARE protein
VLVNFNQLNFTLEPRSVELMSTEMLLKKGADTQDESIRSLDRTNAMIQQSQQIGSEVCIQLTQHGERINTVGSGVEEVESNLEQGKVVLKAFARRMATDRITMALLMIIVVCVLTILVIAVLFPRSKEVNQDTIHPT